MERKLVFVCPECGSLLSTLWESYNLKTSYLISVNGSVVDEVYDDETFVYFECPECIAELYVKSAEDLLMEVAEDDETIYASPVGDYWLERPQELADVLTFSVDKKVKVVSRDQLPA